MKNIKMKDKIAYAACILTVGTSFFLTADNVMADGGGAYVGGSLGVSRVESSDFDDEDHTIKGFAGVKFNHYIGMEVALHDFGKAEEGIFSSELRGASVGVVGYLPLGKSFNLFAKGGMLHWEDQVKVGSIYNDKLDGEEPFIGVGADVHFNNHVSLRVEMERYKVELSDDEVGLNIDESYNVDVASVGVVYTF